MSGKLYGIGVGPGDSGLLTLKAKQILDNSRIIACPVKEKGEESTALNIIKQVVDLSEKEIVEVIFRMDKDKAKREQCRIKAAELLAGYFVGRRRCCDDYAGRCVRVQYIYLCKSNSQVDGV